MTIEQYLQKRYSKSSFSSNISHIHRFTDYYGRNPQRAGYQDILNYLAYLRKHYDLHPKTLRHCLYGVKIYFNYLLETGQRNDHPCSELYLKDKIDKQIRVDKLYPMETLEHFLDTYRIKHKKHLENRNKVIISLLIYQALTVSEITRLQLQDVDLDKGEVYVRGNSGITSKSPQSRILPLQAKQILLFYNYLHKERSCLLKHNKQNPDEQIFLLGQYGEKINPGGISKIINENRPKSKQIQPMKIRQSVITDLLKKENDTRIVQVFAGHKRSSTTVQYRMNELEALQTAIKKYHPLQQVYIPSASDLVKR